MTSPTQDPQAEPKLDDRIWGRQYAQVKGEAFPEGALRTGNGVAKTPEDAAAYTRMILEKLFIPGGRILAGAGSTHGNLLNCFVQDGNPHDDGTTQGALHLAKKLALVTKVGGGNGLNLDRIPAKRPYQGQIGRAYVTIRDSHADHKGVETGTYVDLQIGKQVTRGYREIKYIDSAKAQLAEKNGTIYLRVEDSVAGIWDAATEMVHALLAGKDALLDLTDLRPEGSEVKGSGGTSSGPASFAVEIYDNFAKWAGLGGAEHAGPVATLRYVYAPTLRAIRHAGVRRGAGMATLSATHDDLLDFITAKDLERERDEGDIGTFNISVLADDAFMRAATNDPGSREATVLDAIAQHAWQTGEPGIIFIDAINLHNPLAEIDGPIMATNPCVTGDTQILTTEGPRAFRELAEAGRDVTVWTVDPKTRDMTVRVMRNPRKTRSQTPIVKVTFDSGLELRCTPDHNLFTLAGEKVQAQQLQPGDSVLAYGGAPATQYVPIPTGAQDRVPAAVNHKVVTVQPAGVEDVYNGTVDEHHTYLIPDQLPSGMYAGGVVSANCGEIPLYPAEPCDLGAINLAAFVRVDDKGKPYYDALGLQETARLAVKFLDDVLDAEVAPLQEIHDAIHDKRRIGLGLMGLADMLIKLGLRYDSEEGRAMAQQVVSDLRDAALDESAKLGRERGIPEGVKRAGLHRRNIAVFTVAPTGTTSMLAGVSGGVEPMFAATFLRKIGTDYVTVVQPLLDEILDTLNADAFVMNGGSDRFVAGADGGYDWDREKLGAALSQHKGSLLPLLADLPTDARLTAFVTAHDIAPKDHVLMQAAIQRTYDWVNDDAWREGDKRGMTLAGNSLSKTINMPNAARVDDVHEAYRIAWSEGCFTSGNDVYTSNGIKDISEVQVGDEVLGHDGGLHRVTETFELPPEARPFVTLQIAGMENLRATKNHPLLVIELDPLEDKVAWTQRKKQLVWKAIGDVQIGDHVVVPKHLTRDASMPPFIDVSKALDEKVVVRDGLAYPARTLPWSTNKNVVPAANARGVPSRIDIDDDLMYFLGWYVAEGYVSQGRYVRLSLGLHESVVAERLSRITADKFHAVTKQTEIRSNGGVSLRLEFCSSVIAQLLTKLVGNGARNKHLPTGYARLEPRILRSLVDAHFAGDAGVTMSRQLARELVHARLLLGSAPNFKNDYGQGYVVKDGQDSSAVAKPFDAYLCYRVWAKAEEIQNVPVYNFAVENADSYIVNGIATHNCKGITVYRDSSRDLQVLTTGASEPKTEEQPAHEPQTDAEPAPAAAPASLAAYERPQRMHGFTDQVKLMEPDGDKRGFFITVNSNGNDDPREVFIISGKGGDEANADSEALGRVVSIALQWGVPPEAIVKTLRGINGGMLGSYRGRLVHSKADLIAVALETANDAKPAKSEQLASSPATPSKPGKNGGRCPKCGGPLIRTEGCETCSDPACGYSRCG